MSRAVILAYHAVGNCSRTDDEHNLFVAPGAFEAQMRFLARRRTVVPLDAAVRGDIPTASLAVAITFDDGYVNVLENAAPVLHDLGLPATVFVPTGWTGKRNGWIEPTSCDVEIMTDEQLRAVEEVGVRVESHGNDHIDMAAATHTEIMLDLDASKRRIRVIADHDTRCLVYPYGHHSRAANEAARCTGFDAAFTIDTENAGRFAYERVQVTPLDNLALFALKTSGRYTAIRRSRGAAALYSRVRPLVRRALDRS